MENMQQWEKHKCKADEKEKNIKNNFIRIFFTSFVTRKLFI